MERRKFFGASIAGTAGLMVANAAEANTDGNSNSKIFDSVADMTAAVLNIGDYAITKGYHEPGDGGHGKYMIVAAGAGDNDKGSFHDADDNSFQAQLLIDEIVYVKQFGAHSSQEPSYNTLSIQAALDLAATKGGRCTVSLGGSQYEIDNEIFVKQDTVLKDGTLLFEPELDDIIAVNIGTLDGSYLVRVAGVDNVEVIVSSSKTGLVGFNISHGARGCFINNCRARMSNGDPKLENRGHIGFSIYGVKNSLAIIPGAYQNKINGCAAYSCDKAYRLDTDGYHDEAEGFKPQMNGNNIVNCSAYSCHNHALFVGEGAQDNIIEVRADTFVDSNGTGSVVKVCEVRGSFNTIRVSEEIGSVGDTQYVVTFEGDRPKYNTVEYTSQNIVTDDVLFAETGSAVGKNIARNVARPLNINGNDVFVATGYIDAEPGSTDTYDEIILPCPCVLVKALARNGLVPNDYTRFYFAKNGEIDTVQRLTWSNFDQPSTVKSLYTDPNTGGTINPKFIYEENDYVRVRVDQDSASTNKIGYSLFFKALHRN